ncbi:MAG TPA: flagellar assembly protein FliW [Candidatus Anammoximicrobium sp.]|nr:flagellar assembly protein FliW [Candidatus Anammoximicrobium sp.]HPM80153.1 flagellar assembly protein FliW [Candidatus Anammoximicrobium sp.]
MQVKTSRFGTVEIQPEDILLFSRGLIGFESHRHWVLLADSGNSGVAWLQSLTEPGVALPMVSPRRYVPGYRVLIARNQLTPLELAVLDEAFVLVPLGRNEAGLTLNLRGPVIINLNRRIGRQLITSDEQPLQLALPRIPLRLRKIA